MNKLHGLALLSLTLSACGRTPDVTFSYYPVASKSTIVVTQSIDCNAAKTQLFTVESPQVTTAYAVDLTKTPSTIRLKDLDGFFADSDIKLVMTEDGRLQGIDQSTTGQGTAIVKSLVSLAGSAAALGGGAKPAPQVLPECKALASSGGGKPVTLTYTTIVDLSEQVAGNSIPLTNAPSDKALYDALFRGGRLPILDVRLTPLPIAAPSAVSSAGDVPITLQKTEAIQLSFRSSGVRFADSLVVVPTGGTYTLPVPRASLFGKQTFALSLAASGAITSIEYGKTNGAADAGNSIGSILSAPSTITADKTADAKADSDWIVQQQRLVRCKAKPATCS